MLRRFFTLLFCCVAAFGAAQDLHFSQFYLNPLQINPAQTGVFKGDLRASGIYRSQWTSVPVSYRTFGGAVDMKALKRGANLLSGGLLIQHDRAGDAGLKWTQVGLSASAAHALGAAHALSAGFGLALVQRAFDISGLTFKNQWNDYVFDPGLPSKENFNNSSGLSPSLSGGLNWHFSPAGSRTAVNAGVGISHLNRPKVSFDDNPAERLPMRLAVSANFTLPLNEFFDLVVFGLSQRMGKAQEIVGGAGARFWLVTNETALQFTLANRAGDAIIPALQYEKGNWTVGVSYDINISGFDVATGRRGGFEVAAVYRTLPAPPVKTFKSCPVF